MFDATAKLTWQDRIDNYNQRSGFPRSLSMAGDGRCYGHWLLGNDYRNKSPYYGAYPPNYLRRVRCLFPDKCSVLHLFSGKVDTEAFPGDTVDINPDLNPTYIADAQDLKNVPLFLYDLVLVDPPYSIADAAKYGTTMPNRLKVMRALERLRTGAHVVWLDTDWPMWRKAAFTLEGAITILRSANHRVREVFIYRRLS